MKETRPRIKKAGKKPVRKEKVLASSRIGVPWGRAASPYRPGLFIREYFFEHEEACCADVYYELSREIERLNEERLGNGDNMFRRPNYSSFSRYFHWFVTLEMVERTDRTEPAVYPFLRKRQFYRLTEKGKTEQQAWQDPVRTRHPEFAS